MDYTDTLDKALSHLRELEVDKALNLFYLLLDEHPKDRQLIQRIYTLELKRRGQPGYQKICHHIFSLSSGRDDIRELVVNTWSDFSQKPDKYEDFSAQQTFNLLHHLAYSHFQSDAEELIHRIKQQYATDKQTPSTLYFYCEALIAKKKIIKAREELKYLITFYAETPQAMSAVPLLKWAESQIIN